MAFESAEKVLKAAIEYGGVFATTDYDMGRKTALAPMGNDSQGKSPPQLYDPGNAAYGIAEAIEQKWIMMIPASGYVYDEFLQMNKPGTVGLHLVTQTGRERLTEEKNQPRLIKAAEEAAVELVKQIGGDQFVLLSGCGFVDIPGANFPREKLGLALAFAIFRGWIKVAGSKFVVTDTGHQQH